MKEHLFNLIRDFQQEPLGFKPNYFIVPIKMYSKLIRDEDVYYPAYTNKDYKERLLGFKIIVDTSSEATLRCALIL